jgi:predicted secreted protein
MEMYPTQLSREMLFVPILNTLIRVVADVAVTNIDEDVAGVTVSPTSGLKTTEGGGTATFTVKWIVSQPPM